MLNDTDKAQEIQRIREAAMYRLRTEGVAVAVQTLIEISGDRTAPKNARVVASRTLGEMNGLGGLDALGIEKPLSEMTRAELSAAKDRAIAYLAELERPPVIEGIAIEVQDGEAGEPPELGLFD
ncbi:hypothetical protein [Methylobacterium persicinum]|uniref:Uncharacterized protein n=1 Tax=Methylobacterium persicinum TaxID=374426 RepID=A0ABU0HQH1_9HYPH|nr:hypothetical protein [Methylobacterium persicinum]MDQ0444555.1 hypothetical protein [Methylobacterium persicinum]GJE40451.1 hypothetical protein KHHGKMAE_4544 [Methylobacterium persicinum]